MAIERGFRRIGSENSRSDNAFENWSRPIDRQRGDDSMATMNGTIKRLVSDKGFGFIAAGDGTEYFFHQSACNEVPFSDLREGQAVTFERGQGPKGPRGENVRPA
jgi:CspA family cold shock protein